MTDTTARIIYKIQNGFYDTALVKKVYSDKFPSPKFSGKCFIRLKTNFLDIEYCVFIEYGFPNRLAKAKKQYSYYPSPLVFERVDIPKQDLTDLWDVISVIEKNKRQK